MARTEQPSLAFYQVDAFTTALYHGNPAAVVPMQDEWLSDEQLLAIAAENNLSETAFILASGAEDDFEYELRWFTPTVEVDLCGHATMAASWVIFNEIDPGLEFIRFQTRFAGMLTVTRNGDKLELDFPERPPRTTDVDPAILKAIGGNPTECLKGERDFIFIYKTEDEVNSIVPDYAALKKFGPQGYIVSAIGAKHLPQNSDHPVSEDTEKFSLKEDFKADKDSQLPDFISRCFYPGHGIEEDPVTGSAHCTSASYWATKLNLSKLYAIQKSAREGHLWITVEGGRVKMAGHAKLVIEGKIYI